MELPDCRIRSQLARQPRQRRSQERVSRILKEGRALIAAEGLRALSIPRLAEQLAFPRATIYKFFPTSDSVVHALGEREAERLAPVLRIALDGAESGALPAVVHTLADFYNDDLAAAALLFLALTHEGDAPACRVTTTVLSEYASVHDTREDLPIEDLAVIVELIHACFRLSHRHHGKVADTYRQHAIRAATGYLNTSVRLFETLRA